jgi:peptide/nickel transport system permease protein
VAATADLLRHLALPTACLALAGWAYAARYARAAFRTVLAPEAMVAARARGLHGVSLARHFAPNAALPFVWMVAGIVPALVSGSVVIEAVFSWPGLGQLLLRGVEGRDYPLVMALVLFSAVTVLAGQLVADLLLPAIDPRLRDSVGREEDARG